MNRKKIESLIDSLKQIINELESEVKSDPGSYTLDYDYSELLTYYQTNDDDGEF